MVVVLLRGFEACRLEVSQSEAGVLDRLLRRRLMEDRFIGHGHPNHTPVHVDVE